MDIYLYGVGMIATLLLILENDDSNRWWINLALMLVWPIIIPAIVIVALVETYRHRKGYTRKH